MEKKFMIQLLSVFDKESSLPDTSVANSVDNLMTNGDYDYQQKVINNETYN